MTTRQFKIYAPLQDFFWKGSDLELTPGLWIRRFSQKPDLQGLDETLTEDEKTEVFFYAEHWLTFNWTDGADTLSAEIVNLFLLALWIVKPTRSHVMIRFHVGDNDAEGDKCLSRLLDRFAWIPGITYDQFEDSDLQLVSSTYPVLQNICRASGRLNDALILTLTGCWSHQWQVALLCHAAAAEAILTYESGGGITNRLAYSYACLVATEDSEGSISRAARSNIMHGRTYKVPPSERLNILARFQGVLRTLWRHVLSSPQLITVLEGTDSSRKHWFLSRQHGYSRPRSQEG
jgi:hypothetical protein